MVSWSVELSEFDIRYESRTAIKAQALADFLAEMVEDREPQEPRWMLHVDGAFSSKGSGAGVILEKEGEITVDFSIKFDFSVLNNQVKYETLIARLRLARDVGGSLLTICSNS